MAVAENVLKYLNLVIDGRGQFGKISDYTLPGLALSLEELRAGGMDAPIDLEMGQEKLTFSGTLHSYDPDTVALFGLRDGSGIQWTARGSLEDLDGTARPCSFHMRGKLTSLDRGTWQGGAKPSLSFQTSLTYYREVVAGRVLHEIDVLNMKRVVDGTDVLATHRANIGI